MECRPCARQNRKRRGRRRAHRCTGWATTASSPVQVTCGCVCVREAIDRISRVDGWPVMALDSLEAS